MPRLTTGAILLAGALLLAAAPTMAQTVIGRLVNEATGEAVDGAFVVLVDSVGAEHGGVLTNDEGRFFARAPRPGTYRLKVERIGFATRFSDELTLAAGETISHTMRLAFQAIELDAITVEGEQRCSVRPGEGARTAEVWDEARKALRLAAWTQDQEAVRFRSVQYRRVLDPETGRVLSEQRNSRTGYNRGSPFRSVPAEELEAQGYVVQDVDGAWLYRAPDAEVLLSESFLDTHCFELRSSDDPGLIGLGFRPVGERDPADIRGTMWLDRETAELRWLEFAYTELPYPVNPRGLGGSIEFDRVRGGPWIVREWSIRMPNEVARVYQTFQNVDRVRYEVRTIAEAGGEVFDVVDEAGASLEDDEEGGAISGVVFDSAGFVAMAGVTVTVGGANKEVTTSGNGRFRVDGLLGGRYGITLTPRSWEYPWPPPERTEVEVPEDGVAQVRLTLPTHDDVARGWCPAAPDSLPGVIVGRVGSAGAAGSRARVILAWHELRVAPTWSNFQDEQLGTVVRTGQDGWFRACGVPLDREVRMVAVAPDADVERALRRLWQSRRQTAVPVALPSVRLRNARLARQDLELELERSGEDPDAGPDTDSAGGPDSGTNRGGPPG